MTEIPAFIEVREIVEGNGKFLEEICRPMHYHFATAPCEDGNVKFPQARQRHQVFDVQLQITTGLQKMFPRTSRLELKDDAAAPF